MVNISKKDDIIKISVIGGSRVETDIYNLACEVGREIAKNKAVLICGGLSGVMEAACKGAGEEEGLTIGLLPFTDEKYANKYVDIKIPTGIGLARNLSVVLASHAVIAVDGSSGTLSEISYALTYKKPVIGLKTWELKAYYSENTPHIIRAGTAREAVKKAIKEAKKYKDGISF
ncbi:MAG: TIGR00725 family protein [Actinomycetota bacterium]|nr:TIGR00725 family protein [Actinomycetota bacterium]